MDLNSASKKTALAITENVKCTQHCHNYKDEHITPSCIEVTPS